MAGEADIRDGHRALIAQGLVHHQQGVHVVVLHPADALVDATVLVDHDHAGAHDVGGGEVGGGGAGDVAAQKVPHLLGGGVLQHLLRRGGLDDVPPVQKDDQVGQVQGLVHVVGDKDDGFVQLLLQALDLQLEGAAGHGVQGAEGFVHQHHRGRGGQGTEDTDALLLAAGQLRGVFVGVGFIGQTHHVQHPAHQVVIALPGRAQQPGHNADVLGHRHVGEQAHLLNDIANTAAELIPVRLGHVLAPQIDVPAVGLDEPVDHLQGGGLSAAGRADEDGELPLFDFKIQVV